MTTVRIDTCLACKKVFQNPNKNRLCPSCMKLMEDRFDDVRRYVRDNDKVGLAEVSEACHVPKGQILKWVREERLYFKKGSDVGVPCLKCGATIQTGNYCDKCRKVMKTDLKSVYVAKDEFSAHIKPKGKNQMHYLNKDK